MKIADIARMLKGTLVVSANPQKTASSAYISDLLSDVMAHAKEGCVWMTIQSHQNVVAVAALTGIVAVVFTGGVRPDEHTVAKAQSEGINLIITDLSSYEAAGILYTAGLGANP